MPRGVYDHWKMRGDNNPARRLEVREKISVAKKGKKRPDITGDKSPSKRPIVREKLRLLRLGKPRPDLHGENSPSKRPEVRRKISLAHTGMTYPSLLGSNNPAKRPEVRKKISLALKGKPRLSIRGDKHYLRKHPEKIPHGEKHPNWKGGISALPYSFDFKRMRKKVDRKKCFICGGAVGKIDVHHIDYNKMNSSVSNLVPLCVSCHMKTNYNRDYWKEYFRGGSVASRLA